MARIWRRSHRHYIEPSYLTSSPPSLWRFLHVSPRLEGDAGVWLLGRNGHWGVAQRDATSRPGEHNTFGIVLGQLQAGECDVIRRNYCIFTVPRELRLVVVVVVSSASDNSQTQLAQSDRTEPTHTDSVMHLLFTKFVSYLITTNYTEKSQSNQL